MGRPLLVLGSAVALVGLVGLVSAGVIACGGDKPPLTPDTTEPSSTVEGPDGAAPRSSPRPRRSDGVNGSTDVNGAAGAAARTG